ncbi:MAG: hypothetical protein JJE04_00680 [Acidobacteriia bacterium]|nr:hypothetical protein [Terriglobia bacterium]
MIYRSLTIFCLLVECSFLAPAQTPTFNTAGVINQFAMQLGLSPGVQASIFGQNLANPSCTSAASRIPLPTTLCDAQVLVDGKLAAMFFARARWAGYGPRPA